LFVGQLATAFVLQHDEERTIAALTAFAWLYLAAALAISIIDRRALVERLRFGLLGGGPKRKLDSHSNSTTSLTR